VQRDEQEIEHFLNDKFPRIRRLADKIGLTSDSRMKQRRRYDTHGRTWGPRGQTPIVKVSMQRGGYNVLSVVTAQGEMGYSIKESAINGSGISSS